MRAVAMAPPDGQSDRHLRRRHLHNPLIPHTLAVTTLGERKAGDDLNLEVDLMARYAARLLEAKG